MPKIQVGSVGPKDAKIVFIGEAPGIDECARKKPFVGPAGKVLDRVLLRCGLDRDQVYLTNVVKRRLPQDNFKKLYLDPKQMKPNEELLEYWALLQEELSALSPNVIVPLGRQPLYALMGLNGIGKYRGSILSDAQGRKIIPTWHPSAVQRDWALRPTMIRDMQRIRSESWHSVISLPERDFIIRPTFRQTMDYLDACMEAEMVGNDIETSAWQGITCNAFSYDPSHAISIPYIYEGGTYWGPKAAGRIRHRLEQLYKEKPIVGQHYHYDWSWLKQDGFEINNLIFDPWTAHHVSWPELKKSLAFMASIYTREPYWKDDGDHDTKQRTAEEYDKYWEYNARDCAVTLELVEPLQREIDKVGVQSVFDFEMSLIPGLVTNTLRGINFDNEKRKEMRRAAKSKMLELNKAIDAILPETWVCTNCKGKGTVNKVKIKPCPNCKGNIHHINPNSDTQTKKLIYDHLKLPKVLMKDSHKVTLNEMALRKLQVKRPMPIFELLLKFREVAKEYESLGAKLGPDKRMHTELACSTKTGRLASSESPFRHGTNLQNIKHQDDFRSLLRADPGMILLGPDYEKAEAYTMGYEANDPIYIDALEFCPKCKGSKKNPGASGGPCPECKGTGRGDIHTKNARVIFDLDGKPSYEQRQLGKRACHGINYLMGPLTLCEYIIKELGPSFAITMKEAKRFREAYLDTYEGLRHFQEFIKNEIETTRVLYNSYGRRRMFLGRPEGKTIRDAVAFIPQGTVGDHTNRAMLRTINFPEIEFLLQVHDQVIGQCPEEDAERLAKAMTAYMTVPIIAHYTGLEYTIPVEMMIGPSWGELK